VNEFRDGTFDIPQADRADFALRLRDDVGGLEVSQLLCVNLVNAQRIVNQRLVTQRLTRSSISRLVPDTLNRGLVQTGRFAMEGG
jgi:hypothetical protein